MDTDARLLYEDDDENEVLSEPEFGEQENLLEEFNSKLIDGAVQGGIPRTFFQKHGYPPTNTQMTDLDKEMLKKA